MRRITYLLLAAGLLAGCGVIAEREPHVVTPPAGPFRALTSPEPVLTGSGPAQETLYLIRDGGLIAVNRKLDQPSTIDNLIKDLLAGPTPAERETGISSALLGSDVIASWRIEGTIVTVELAAALVDTGRTDEVLGLAQIVCTLTRHLEISGVSFKREGKPIDVPRGDGSVSAGPLTADDYQSLLKPDPARS